MFFCLVIFVLILLSIFYIQLKNTVPKNTHAQGIFTLGGWIDREEFTAQFAQLHPTLNIWVSTGTPQKRAQGIFQAAGIAENRLHLDYRAVDTVTNFTTLVKDFQKHQIKHLYLITSDYHMRRAKWIATIVLGSRGITFTPVVIPSGRLQESFWRTLRDAIRSLVWLVTGYTGASLSRRSAYFASYPYTIETKERNTASK